MNELTPTRSLLIALGDERRTMREGSAFLDEKCLLLAGEMLRETRRQRDLMRTLRALDAEARHALHAALGRHGLDGLQVYAVVPAAEPVAIERRSLLGVALITSRLADSVGPNRQPVHPSPEATACRTAHRRMAPILAELAAVSTNLARLHAEYRRTVRRVRALQDVLLPELDTSIADIDTRLEDLEREDAVASRRRIT
ncbi:MAG: V-type ATP synthase subunit D [Betaproteobacteria bacterium]|jgi:V/A-type H+-transporting ATPase subunit D|nr:V-type ATP synthase subunit D [Betaproteobacteria bacterium]MDH5208642.1 V-type ATP synthase subunit D [Burkholderiaceae bacterium]